MGPLFCMGMKYSADTDVCLGFSYSVVYSFLDSLIFTVVSRKLICFRLSSCVNLIVG